MSSHFQKGKLKTAILLSAPGKKEEELGKPASGLTGAHIREALIHLNTISPESFPSTSLDDYRITNAIKEPQYLNKTNRYEGTATEIKSKDNIERIRDELSNIDVILVLGKKAEIAYENLNMSIDVYKASHPSQQNLVSAFKSNKETSSERNQDRIQQWINSITKI